MIRKLAIIAGEASGDFLGAQLIKALKRQLPEGDTLECIGIGGPLMASEGHTSLFDYSELSLMGFVEILPSIRRLLRRIKETEALVRSQQPDVLISIDAPGFNFRLLKRLRSWPGKKIHYVAPQHWGWRPKRALKLKSLGLTDMLTLFPFEEAFFADYEIDTHFVGHPVAELDIERPTDDAWQAISGLAPDRRVIGMLPGSRGGELKRHLPLLEEVVGRIHAQDQDVAFVWPTLERLADRINASTRRMPGEHVVLANREDRFAAFSRCSLALQASGTVALELAASNLPMITYYRTHPLTWQMLKHMVRVRYANLVNLIADAPVVPEFLQDRATPEALSHTALQMLSDESLGRGQRDQFDRVMRALGKDGPHTPSELAAARILEHLT